MAAKKKTAPLSEEDQRLANLRAELAKANQEGAALSAEWQEVHRAYEEKSKAYQQQREANRVRRVAAQDEIRAIEDAHLLANPLEGHHLALLKRADGWGTEVTYPQGDKRSAVYEAAEQLCRVGLLERQRSFRTYGYKARYCLTDAGRARLEQEQSRGGKKR